MVICLEQGADLHVAQLMPLPLIVSCFSKIQIGFTFLVQAHPGSLGKRAVKRACVCVCVSKVSLLGTFFVNVNRLLQICTAVFQVSFLMALMQRKSQEKARPECNHSYVPLKFT